MQSQHESGGKLPSLDAGRFVAALLVVMFHATLTVINFGGRPPFDGMLRGGHSGVEYFFVLSGFIIYYAHRRDLSRPSAIADYARKRATRILPMLWLVLVPWGLFRIAFAGETTNASTGWTTLILDMLLLPHGGPLVLGVTWTLQRELVFYLLFLTAIFDRRIGLAVLATWQVGIVLATALDAPLGPWGTAIFGVYNLGFGFGLLIAIFGERLRIDRPALLAAAGALAFAALLAIEYRVGGPLEADFRPLSMPFSVLLYTTAAAIAILGLVAHDRRKRRRQSPLVAVLGGSSYVLYLVHGPIGSVVIRAAKPLHLSSEGVFVALVVVPVVAAAIIHVWAERPLLRALRPSRRAHDDAGRSVAAKIS